MVTIMRKVVTLFLAMSCFAFRLDAADTPMPESIKVPDGYQPLTLHAIGDQVFVCVSKAGVYKWQCQSPDAILYDQQNHTVVGKHGAGPSWSYQDGSHVIATVIQKVDAPDKGAAPWLLIKATEHKGGGLLAQIRYIQRKNTHGGIAPVQGCNANHLGSERRVAYSADYIFYSK